MGVFVLLFNVGTDNEGLHTLRISDQNWVLMFEEEDDAVRYAMLLEAQDFPTPAVEAIDQETVVEFCEDAGYNCQLVPKGFVPQSDAERLLIVPPENNIEETDWQVNPTHPSAPAESAEESADAIPNDALDRIRRQLEGLL